MSNKTDIIKVDPKSLPASCPPKDADAWDLHPRVYLEFAEGQATCPYCNAQYQLSKD